MSNLLRKQTEIVAAHPAKARLDAEPASSAQDAAVAAAEAIAAHAAAEIAAEAAAVAVEVVNAASTAAAKAAVKAERAAAEAAAEATTVAEAVIDTASAVAVVAAASADHTGARAAADIATAARAADGAVQAAFSASAKSATRAHLTAVETADELALEAAAVAVDVVAAAAAAAAKVIAAGDAAAKLALATAAAAATAISGVQAPVAAPAADKYRLDDVVHTEWASVLADPAMPRNWLGTAPSETVVSAAPPAEQDLWRDISLARRMQAALRASEANFEAAFRSAPTPMLIVSLASGNPAQFVQVNQALSELTGWAPTELLGFGFTDLAQAEHVDLEQGMTQTSDRLDERPVERLRRWRHANGHEIWVRIRMARLRPSTDGSEELVCQVEDVTAQMNADTALRSAEARFRLAFARAPQPAALIQLTGNRPGRLLAVNRAACTLFGRSEIEMAWLDLESLTDPADRLAVLDLLDRLASGELTYCEGRYRYHTAAGSPGRVALSGHAVNGVDGMPEHLLAYLREDTDDTASPTAARRTPARSDRPPTAELPDEPSFAFDAAWARALDL